MSIPIDRLYHYIENVANEVFGDVIIYRFSPHGSKKLQDLTFLHNVDWYTTMTVPAIICHDQEPLDFDHYENYDTSYHGYAQLLKKYGHYKPGNLTKNTIYDWSILVHSELRSPEVQKYQARGFIPVYYWSHGMISLDWFRFAKHIRQQKSVNKTFLIYNRAWAGTREYRIKVCDLLSQYDLIDHCLTKFNCVDPDTNIHYNDHEFKNPAWRPNNDLSNRFEPNTDANSQSSADFVITDYESTHIEVVLETLFDDSRIHLTEKSLRPIACEQPFIVLAAAGSLSYLKQYGFQTFGDVWDESYDDIVDPYQRLQAVVTLMKHIAGWDADTKNKKLAQAQEIASYNKKYFFSDDFFNTINLELRNNLSQSLNLLESTNTSKVWLDYRKQLAQFPELKNVITAKVPHPNAGHHISPMKETYWEQTQLMRVLHKARTYYTRSLCEDRQDKIIHAKDPTNK